MLMYCRESWKFADESCDKSHRRGWPGVDVLFVPCLLTQNRRGITWNKRIVRIWRDNGIQRERSTMGIFAFAPRTDAARLDWAIYVSGFCDSRFKIPSARRLNSRCADQFLLDWLTFRLFQKFTHIRVSFYRSRFILNLIALAALICIANLKRASPGGI